jgi:hypothetical protein
VDYNTYAEGEAVLGWLNAAIRLTAASDVDWRELCMNLLKAFQAAMQGREIAHAKLLLSTAAGQIVGNLTRTADVPSFRGEITGSPREAELIFNARAEMAPEILQALVERLLREIAGPVTVSIEKMHCLSPDRPRPTHRYETVV